MSISPSPKKQPGKNASYPTTLSRAEAAAGFACLGGQFQFRLSDGKTCEMYWLKADSKDRVPGELWQVWG
jgi:hypothetical protein